jgi:hypothetical protein
MGTIKISSHPEEFTEGSELPSGVPSRSSHTFTLSNDMKNHAVAILSIYKTFNSLKNHTLNTMPVWALFIQAA